MTAFTEEEIKVVVWKMDPTKTPGPDGFTSGFYKNHWSIIGKSVVQVVKSFFHSGHLLKEINCTYLTLIPKIDNPTQEHHFRPICHGNVLYRRMVCRWE